MSALAMTYEGACLEGMNSSALEHSVPEQLFSTPDNPAYGVSAVKAIQIAASQGIPIYTVTRENADTVIPQLSLDAATIQEIQNAVNAGNEVTTSRTTINFHGWQGCGYIVMNPVTGTGAYMISGGDNGGWIGIILGILLVVLGVLALSSIFGAPLGAYLIAMGIALIYTSAIEVQDTLGELLDDVYVFYGESWLNVACNIINIAASCIALGLALAGLFNFVLLPTLFSFLLYGYGLLDVLLSATILNPVPALFEGKYLDCQGILFGDN